jgi:aldehyde decarbonylase
MIVYHLRICITLAAAFILKSIMEKEMFEVLLISPGASKVGSGIERVLCECGVRVQLLVDSEEKIEKSKMTVPQEFKHNLFHVTCYQSCITCNTWIVGRSLSREDQMKAPEGNRFIPFIPFPIPNIHNDCTYETVPTMSVPKNLDNLHAYENGLPRRVMSAWRVGGHR